ncbi:MAG: class I SAM-dependent DNA methyltransferase [Saprospiraceae bacterium]
MFFKWDTLWQDGFPDEEFDYMVSNPTYGKKWGTIKAKVQKANNSRFDAGYPGTGDGQLLFTLHMVSKMKAVESGGSAIAIVHNGSPLFKGGAGSGESEIRRHLIENDWLETVVALPTNLFYNTGIATYIWIVRNNKKGKRVGKIQLINGVDYWEKMQRSLGDKRKRINDKQIAEIIQLHKQFKETEFSKIYDKDDFAFRKVFLELEEQDENGLPLYDTKLVNISAKDLRDNVLINFKSKEEKATLKKILDKKDTEETYYELALIPNSDFIKKYKTPDGTIKLHRYFVGKSLKLQTTIRIPKTSKDDEIIPWKEDRDIFLKREVEKPYKILREEKGYEIPFTREFYKYQPLPKLEEVVEKFAELEGDNQRILSQLGIDLYERV